MPSPGYKLAVIGGGSSYTPELVEGLIARRDRLPLAELALADIEAGREKVEAVAGLARRMLRRAGLEARVTVTFDRRRAIDGADFVLSQFRVGGLRARVNDERIPLAYGIVGQETTGPGGFSKALRTVPVALEVARDVRELAPEAWVMNFTNPAGIVTEAILKHSGGVRCIGLCNVPVSLQRAVCGFVGAEPWRVELDIVGLNHLGWVTAVRLDGEDILPAVLSHPVVEEQFVRNIPGASGIGPLLESLRMLPSPYLQYYYFHDELLAKVKEDIACGKGTRGEQVLAVEEELFARYRDPDLAEKPPELEKRGGAYYSEAAVDVMVSLVGAADGPPDGPRNRHVVNVPNLMVDDERGSGGEAGSPGGGPVLPDLPAGAVIEVPCLVGPRGPRPLGGGPLPKEIRGLIQQVKAYEELTIEAAVTGDRRTAFLALLAHPLVPGVRAAGGLLADILEAGREHLGRFFR
jgi:6-phospho-beta-glucosidase